MIKFLEKKKFITLSVICLFGIMFQLIILLFVLPNKSLLSWHDPKHYYSIAIELSEGLPYSTKLSYDNLLRSPGYPYYLFLLIKIIGKNVLYLRIFHIVLFPLIILEIYYIAVSIGGFKVGVFSSVLATIHPYFLYIPLTLYSETVLLFLYPLIILLTILVKKKNLFIYWVLLALFFVASVFVRPTSVGFIVFIFLYLCINEKNNINLKKCIVLFVLLPFSVVNLWMYRNYCVHGTYLFTTTIYENILMSFNEDSIIRSLNEPLDPYLEKNLNNSANLSERNEIILRTAKNFIYNNPIKATYLCLMRILYYWSPIIETNTKTGEGRLAYKIIIGFYSLPLTVFGFVGLYRLRKIKIFKLFIYILVIGTLITAPFMVSARYRLVYDFLLIISLANALFLKDKHDKETPNDK